MSSSEVKAHREEWLYELSELPALLTVCLRSHRKIKKRRRRRMAALERVLAGSDVTFLQHLNAVGWGEEGRRRCVFRVINIPEKQ